MTTSHALGRRRLSRVGRRWAAALVACALATTWGITPGSLASGATPSSILCSGYTACSQGPFSNHGYPSHAWTSYWQMYAGDNCTNYVAYTESTLGVLTPSYDLGNADEWVASASAHGVLVNHTPTVGAVAVWYGDMGWSGHVAVVEAVGAKVSYVVISQQHMITADGFDWVRIFQVPSENQWQVWPNAFIHFPVASVVQPWAHDLSRESAQFRAVSARASVPVGVNRRSVPLMRSRVK